MEHEEIIEIIESFPVFMDAGRRWRVELAGRIIDSLEREAGAGRLDAIEILYGINLLREGEGDSVTICCDNPGDNDLPNCCIIVNAGWTDWKDKEYRGDELGICLEMAVGEMKAAKQ